LIGEFEMSGNFSYELIREFEACKESQEVLDQKLQLWKKLDQKLKDFRSDTRAVLFGSCMTGSI
jgi:hypothetical protein